MPVISIPHRTVAVNEGEAAVEGVVVEEAARCIDVGRLGSVSLCVGED